MHQPPSELTPMSVPGTGWPSSSAGVQVDIRPPSSSCVGAGAADRGGGPAPPLRRLAGWCALVQEGRPVGQQRTEDGHARAPPICRLVLNTPLAVPVRWAGTLLSRTAVTGGMISGPARPTGTISPASAQTGVEGGARPRVARSAVIRTSPAVMSTRAPSRSTRRALNARRRTGSASADPDGAEATAADAEEVPERPALT